MTVEEQLELAVLDCDFATVRRILAAGFDVRAPIFKGVGGSRSIMGYAMIEAVCSYNTELLQVVLEYTDDADSPLTHGDHKLPLHTAVYGLHGSVSLLIAKGANPNLFDDNGMTALHYAMDRARSFVEYDESAISVRLLVDAGADTTLLTGDGRSLRDLVEMQAGLHRESYQESLLLLAIAAERT